MRDFVNFWRESFENLGGFGRGFFAEKLAKFSEFFIKNSRLCINLCKGKFGVFGCKFREFFINSVNFFNFSANFREFFCKFPKKFTPFYHFKQEKKFTKNSPLFSTFALKFTLFVALFLALQTPLKAQDEQYLQTQRMQLETQTREFNEARAALQSYRESFLALQRQKMDELIKKEADINATLARIEATKAENERILQQNESHLKSIADKSESRIKDIYSQMKDSAIAGVLNEMSAEEASKIILVLEARKISSVLAKMEPAKASAITLILQDANATTPQ